MITNFRGSVEGIGVVLKELVPMGGRLLLSLSTPTGTCAENSEVLPAVSVAVAVTFGPVSPSGFIKVKAPVLSEVVKPS